MFTVITLTPNTGWSR